VQQGAQISGTLVTSLGTSQVRDGRVTASGFSFGGTVEFGGQTISYTVQATVTGNTFTGTLDSPQGPVPITGTKNP
jgi:dienelactone hydrolase